MMEYLRERQLGGRSIKYSSVTLSGLCNEGIILLPVLKSKEQEREQQEDVHNRMLLLSAAKSGDPQAIESLTLDDIDTYSKVSRRLISEDVFTIVDTYIMPYGIECDRYSIMGEILEYRLTRNEITREDICIMKLDVNGFCSMYVYQKERSWANRQSDADSKEMCGCREESTFNLPCIRKKFPMADPLYVDK